MESVIINGIDVDLVAGIIKSQNKTPLNLEKLLKKFDISSLSKLIDYFKNTFNDKDYKYLESAISSAIIDLYDNVYYLIGEEDEEYEEYIKELTVNVDKIISASDYDDVFNVVEDLFKRDITFIIKLLIIKGETSNYEYVLRANDENSALLYEDFKSYVQLNETEVEMKTNFELGLNLIDVVDISESFHSDIEFREDLIYVQKLNELFEFVVNNSVYEPEILKLLDDYNNRYSLNRTNQKIRILY